MVYLKPIILSAFVAAANADNLRAPVLFQDAKRHLSYDFIAGYRPDSSVTDHNAIDLDQAAIVSQVSGKSQEAFNLAKQVYEEGGHSKSFAKLTFTGDVPPSTSLTDKTRFVGKTEGGQSVYGKVYKSSSTPSGQIWLQYDVSDVQASYVDCQVGGLSAFGGENTKGCFNETGVISIPDSVTTYPYTYDPKTDNDNGRTIQGFSTSVQSKMLSGCSGCPYRDAKFYADYYGDAAYADKWVQAAVSGGQTAFSSGRGNADFTKFGYEGRSEAIKKGTAYMSVFMYVIREFEDALDDCKSDCIKCNDDPVHAWDEGVAFYTGSLEGERGESKGELLHALADKRCVNFNTCTGDQFSTSKVNQELFQLFAVGQAQLLASQCDLARETTAKVVDLMYVPLIQGTLRYAHKVDRQNLNGEKERAEGAVFAASILPRIHAADAAAAQTIYENMKVGAPSTDYKAVRDAFESVYSDLNIDCEDVGGLVDATGAYFEGAGPCKSKKSGAAKAGQTAGIVVGVAGGAVALAAVGYIFFLRGREKQGKPVFAPQIEEEQFKDVA